MRYLLITALLFLTFEVKAQIPDSLIAHLDSALLLLKEKSLYHKKVDWDKVKAEMYSRAAQARTKNETFNAIAYGFAQLNDKHGFFMQNGRRYRLTDSIHLNRLSDSLKVEWGKGWKIHMKMLGKVAYFRMPNINAFNQKQVNSYANQLYDSIAHLASQKPQSSILDLRRNAGGNIRPMMAALAPFFDDGIVSYELDRDDRVTGYSAFKNGDYVSN
ncbi:MAG TPA: S41 family peptidase, partial [Sphingobacteriaceae bacterium]